MDYTIEIINASSRNMKDLKVIELDTISPSVESLPKIPYDEYKDDMTKYLTNAIQIPLYERQQYLILPKDSILRITTNNSDEAVFYATNKIENGIISISPNPFNPGGSSDGLIIVPEGTILEEGSLEIGPKKWAVKLEGNNFKDSYEDSFITYDVDSYNEFSMELSKDENIALIPILPYVCYATTTEDFGNIINNGEPVINNMNPKAQCCPIVPIYKGSSLYEACIEIIMQLIQKYGFKQEDVSCVCVFMDSIYLMCISEIPESFTELIFWNYDESTGLIQSNLTNNIEFIPNKSLVFIPQTTHYYSDETLESDFTEVESADEIKGVYKLLFKTNIKNQDDETLCLSGSDIVMALTINRTVAYFEFKPHTYYKLK